MEWKFPNFPADQELPIFGNNVMVLSVLFYSLFESTHLEPFFVIYDYLNGKVEKPLKSKNM